jgi:DNA polymerase-3 subunit alpha
MLNVISRSISNVDLRSVVLAQENSSWFIENKENILFELNHLELHNLDGYLLYLFTNKIKVNNNKPNSSIAYLLGITDQKPLGQVKTKGGTTPDIDSDFEDIKRDSIKQYLKDKYGQSKVADIGTFQISKCKGVFKDVSRIFELPFEESNIISKMLPDDMDASIKEAVELPEIKKLIANDERLKRIFEYACHIEGSLRAVGVHASGVAVSNVDMDTIVPLFESKGEQVTQFDGTTLEKLGIIKFDILGLKNLTTISNTLSLIKKQYNIDIDLYKVNYDDPIVYKYIATGDLLGIFQIEGSTGLMEFAKKSQPLCISDLSAIIALYRPGPMGMGALDMYLKRVTKKSQAWEFEIPAYSYIFKETYGLLVYQEQLMKLSKDMCGFTDIEADELRKAVGKKDRELLLKQKDKFINGAINKKKQEILERRNKNI